MKRLGGSQGLGADDLDVPSPRTWAGHTRVTLLGLSLSATKTREPGLSRHLECNMHTTTGPGNPWSLDWGAQEQAKGRCCPREDAVPGDVRSLEDSSGPGPSRQARKGSTVRLPGARRRPKSGRTGCACWDTWESRPALPDPPPPTHTPGLSPSSVTCPMRTLTGPAAEQLSPSELAAQRLGASEPEAGRVAEQPAH